jgi:ABC-2 type transport system permease protein
MHLYRAYALALRHWYQLRSDTGHMLSLLYWPIMDIILIGYLGVWVDQSSANPEKAFMLIIGVIMWQFVVRGIYDVSVNFLFQDIWAHNMGNLFSSPLSLSEWIVASLLFSLSINAAILIVSPLVGWVCFGVNMFSLGTILIPTIISLIMFGLAVGYVSSGFLMYCGARYINYLYMSGWVFSAVSGAYFDVAILPVPLRMIARLFPLSYTFDVIRAYSSSALVPVNTLIISILLSGMYLIFSIVFFKWMFERSRSYGLSRLVD